MAKSIQDQAYELIQAGSVIAVGEYRLCENTSREYQSKETGKRETFSGVWHTVEIGNKSIQVADATVPSEKVDSYKSPFKKGSQVFIVCESHGYVSGKGERWKGRIIPVL